MLKTVETCHQAEEPSLNVAGCGIPSIPVLPSMPTGSMVRREEDVCDDHGASNRFSAAKFILQVHTPSVFRTLGTLDAFGLYDPSSIPLSFRHYAQNELLPPRFKRLQRGNHTRLNLMSRPRPCVWWQSV
jgi:hypothetical protein